MRCKRPSNLNSTFNLLTNINNFISTIWFNVSGKTELFSIVTKVFLIQFDGYSLNAGEVD